MKSYDPNIRTGVHTIEITIQQWEFVGHIRYRFGGNCKGKEVLDVDFFFLHELQNLESDCQLKYGEECDCLSVILKDGYGNKLEIKESAEDFNNMIVKVEILDYVEEERGE